MADGLDRLRKFTEFLDHEICDHYWDETLYKKLRDKSRSDDDLSQRLRRIRLAEFTDISYLDALPGDCRVYTDDVEETEGIYGRFAAALMMSEIVAVVDLFNMNLPTLLTVWEDDVQKQPIKVRPILRELVDAVKWFAETRKPIRKYNSDYHKHGIKERKTGDRIVSPMALSGEEIEYALSHAIGSRDESRLVHFDADRRLIVVFSYENREDKGSPVYHGHHFKVNQRDIEKLPQTIIRKLEWLYKCRLDRYC